uniref:F-box/LRR-repeat protein 15/At3g58940/PEG3-like LRR domain-containing protein n=1 Tax=Solanum tuberosum TaxID=4113 RepID=M1DHP2_SOLTU
MLQTLLNSCPLIVTFNLEYCSVLKKIELLNLQKIKSVSMRMCRYQRVKIEAPTLEHLFLSGFEDEYPMLDIIDAPNLVSLEYLGNQIPKTFVEANFQWSCHPTRFILGSNTTRIKRFLDCLLYMKNSSHSTSCGNKDLHSMQLKEVKAYKFDHENQRWHHVQLESGNLLSLRKLERFCFILDW